MTEPYNKYEPLQINQVPCILAVTALILFRFENQLYCLVLKIGCFVPFRKSAVLSRSENRLFCLVLKSSCWKNVLKIWILTYCVWSCMIIFHRVPGIWRFIFSRRFMKWNATIIVTLFVLSTRTDQNSSTKVLQNIIASKCTIWSSELNQKGFSCFSA